MTETTQNRLIGVAIAFGVAATLWLGNHLWDDHTILHAIPPALDRVVKQAQDELREAKSAEKDAREALTRRVEALEHK
jgi:hypothetical protein